MHPIAGLVNRSTVGNSARLNGSSLNKTHGRVKSLHYSNSVPAALAESIRGTRREDGELIGCVVVLLHSE